MQTKIAFTPNEAGRLETNWYASFRSKCLSSGFKEKNQRNGASQKLHRAGLLPTRIVQSSFQTTARGRRPKQCTTVKQ